MGQHIDIIANYIGDTDIIARFRIRQLRVTVLMYMYCSLYLSLVIHSHRTASHVGLPAGSLSGWDCERDHLTFSLSRTVAKMWSLTLSLQRH